MTRQKYKTAEKAMVQDLELEYWNPSLVVLNLSGVFWLLIQIFVLMSWNIHLSSEVYSKPQSCFKLEIMLSLASSHCTILIYKSFLPSIFVYNFWNTSLSSMYLKTIVISLSVSSSAAFSGFLELFFNKESQYWVKNSKDWQDDEPFW